MIGWQAACLAPLGGGLGGIVNALMTDLSATISALSPAQALESVHRR